MNTLYSNWIAFFAIVFRINIFTENKPSFFWQKVGFCEFFFLNIYRFACFFLFVILSSQAFGISKDVKSAIKNHYLNADYQIARQMLEKVVADTNRTDDDRQYAFIYLGLIELLYNNTTQVDDYLCRLLSLKPDFEPEFSTRDITQAFTQQFYQLKSQNLCLPVEKYAVAVKKAMAEQNFVQADNFIDKWEKLLPSDSPQHDEVKKLRRELGGLKILFRGKLPSVTNSPIQEPDPTPQKTCQGVIGLHVKALLTRCQALFQKQCVTTCPGEEETALTCYQKAQKSCPDSPDVQKGFQDMEDFYVNLANRALRMNRTDRVKRYLESLKKVNPQSPIIADIERRL